MTLSILSKAKRLLFVSTCIFGTALAGKTTAETAPYPALNAYGVPGLIDTPTAHVMRDADLATTLAITADSFRATLSFQIAPRLTGSFRYSGIRDFDSTKSVDDVFYDRSFDIRYQVLKETENRPSVVIGLQDFMGTGLFGAEYIVASKTVSPGLTFSGGIGWGRLGSANPFGQTGKRKTDILGEGGVPNADRWFRGDVAAFGGVSYAPNDRVTYKLEYSSDNYTTERKRAGFDGASQWNAGVDLKFKNGGQLSLFYNYGDTVGLQYSLINNPRHSPAPSGLETAPLPVAVRTRASMADLGWSTDNPQYAQSLGSLLKNEGIILEGITLTKGQARVRINNQRYHEMAQAVGRTARAMTRSLPGSIGTFVIIPTNGNVPISAVTLKRSDLENLEHDSAEAIYHRAQITDAAGMSPELLPGQYPKFTWGLAPDLKLSAFDPDSPIRADLGLNLKASYRPTPNFLISGQISSRLTGNLNKIKRDSPTGLPPVRTDFREYARNGRVALKELTLNHFGRPGKDLYSRLTVGYLETMYGGASAELLWKPVDSRLALGIEVNAVKQRDFDGGFGFRDYETLTGHVSAYYDFGRGYIGQIDAGRYLAEDWGATVSLDREFPNGWRIGAFATFTNVSAKDFGEGSFDKGIRITIPTSSITGQPSKSLNAFNVRSLTRDGGARVEVPNRLYDSVRRGHDPEMVRSWGRFWR